MTLTRINVTVRHEQLKAAREMGLNISELVRKSLDNALQTDDIMEYKSIIELLKVKRLEIEDTIKTLEQKLAELEEEKMTKEKELKKKYKKIPEVQGLTPEFLADTKAVLALIDVIRQKYPETRAAVAEIRKYYELIEK